MNPLGQRPASAQVPLEGWEREKNASLAASTVDPNLVVGGFELYGTLPETFSRYVTSTDGGRTWRGGSFNGTYFGDLEARQDSLIGFDAAGTAYYMALAFSSTHSGYLVFTSTDGISWGQPSQVVVTDYTEYRFPADFAIDPRMPGSAQYAGSLYFASPYYHNAPPYDQGLHLRYSRDGGLTWGADAVVSDPDHQYDYRPSMTVASNGTVYIAFSEVLSGTIFNDPRLFLDRSTDGGQTWGTDNLITGNYVVPIGEPDWKYHELVLIASSNCDLVRINHFPIVGVSPTNPNEVYITWNDGRWDLTEDLCGRENARHGDIAFTRSTDGGSTWSTPIRVNDDPQGNGIDQWQPTMEVAPDGTIGISWYDRRYSSDPYFFDVAYSQSTDGGLTWSANQRVSDQSSDPVQLSDAKGIDDLGIRSALVVQPDYVLPAWIDTRDAPQQGHIYVDHGSVSSPTPGPSSTSTIAASPTRTVPPTATRTATHISTSQPTLTPTPTSTLQVTLTPQPSLSPEATVTPQATSTTCTLTFTDVPVGSTFYPYIHCLACLGIINGYPDGTFRPNNLVTRGQLSKIVSNAAGFSDTVSGQSFEDVPPGSTFYTFTERLVSRSVMSGYPCGSPGEPCVPPDNLPYFRPNSNATRGQISKIVSQAAGYSDPPGAQIFEDVAPGSTFYDYIQRLASRGYMNGYPCGSRPGEPCTPPYNLPWFRPSNNATRGQTSKIVSNAFFPSCTSPSHP
jgi:hypothetical protein